jgi:transcriptional antiterminator RfaH
MQEMSVRVTPITEEPRWLVVNTQPHRENVALANLKRQGFFTYCPFVTKRIKHARQTRDVLRPLFPGYLFVQAGPELVWRPIASTLGVRSIIRFGDQVSLVENGFVASLQAREVDGVIVRPARAFEVGQQVRVAGATFDQLVGTIIELEDRGRLIVLMNLLNNQVKVTVPAQEVEAL